MSSEPQPQDDQREGAVLFADVSGSTTLFQQIGDQAAFAAIRQFLDTLQSTVLHHNGTFVKNSGDDVLCWFPSAADAVAAAREMMQITGEGDISVHAGLEWGNFLDRNNDIFGDCVNTAARLCDLSNTRELLMGEMCFQRLDAAEQAEFVTISPMRLKGRSDASHIYSLQLEDTGERTHLSDVHHDAFAKWDAVFRFGEQTWRITEGEALTVGRQTGNMVEVPVQKVSRLHATIRLTNGLVEYEDHSNSGSMVAKQSEDQFLVLRRTVVLSGSGTVFLGTKIVDPDAPPLYYEVVPR